MVCSELLTGVHRSVARVTVPGSRLRTASVGSCGRSPDLTNLFQLRAEAAPAPPSEIIDRRGRKMSRERNRPLAVSAIRCATRFGPGGPGSLPSQGSHRPGRARIRASGSSTNSFAIQMVPEAIRSTYVDMFKEPQCVQHVALDRFCWSTLRFPPLGPPGRVPLLQRYYQSATTSYRHLAALRFLRLAIPQRPLVVFAPWRTSEPPWPGVGNPVSPAGNCRGAKKSRTLPSSWGTSMFRLPCSNPTPAGLLVSDHFDTAAWPLVCKKQRLPRKVFRSSIAWLSDWLSTLRNAGYPNTTQDSLPVAGQALLNGISTRKVPLKGFKVVDYISFPLPKLCFAQLHRPRRVEHLSNLLRSRHRSIEPWPKASINQATIYSGG